MTLFLLSMLFGIAGFYAGMNIMSQKWVTNVNSKKGIKLLPWKEFKVVQIGNVKSFKNMETWMMRKGGS